MKFFPEFIVLCLLPHDTSQTRPYYFPPGSGVRNPYPKLTGRSDGTSVGLFDSPVCKSLVETIGGSTCYLLDPSPLATWCVHADIKRAEFLRFCCQVYS